MKSLKVHSFKITINHELNFRFGIHLHPKCIVLVLHQLLIRFNPLGCVFHLINSSEKKKQKLKLFIMIKKKKKKNI